VTVLTTLRNTCRNTVAYSLLPLLWVKKNAYTKQAFPLATCLCSNCIKENIHMQNPKGLQDIAAKPQIERDRRVGVTLDGAWIGWLDWRLIHNSGLQANSAIADVHTLQFTIAHALGLAVFTIRILATDLSQSDCNFKSHMESSFHRLIPFFPLFCSCQIRRIDSIQFQAHIPAAGV
jgi:hypothetical protein